MDATVSIPKSKTQKIANVGGGGDRISNLPNVVLHRIISMLPTKEEVATSLLTKQWKHLWISISNLEFWDSSHGISSDQVKQMKDRNRKVDAQSLVSLNYTSLGSSEYSFPNLCSLVTASVNIKRREGRHVYHKLYNWTTKFLKEISNAKILTLADGTFEVMKEECWEDDDFEDDMVPGCLLTHLKALKIGILSENKNPKSKYKNSRQVDLSFVKYFLKNALVLENMTIISSDYLSKDPEMQMEDREQLLRLPLKPRSLV
ncbi:hypothetical protein GIB67_042841 [Kingdonia uniflora]|uniref:F-box domain-containing protein n=1 Tax=Kingdonia uniflora TaxID=39325 RepID=A0A7J7NS76_9MAGN|nr:hypothetical protein GIB67_042841 [Kingdonia uniflora]